MSEPKPPTAAQLRNIERCKDGWKFAGQGQITSCDAAVNRGWLEYKLMQKSATVLANGDVMHHLTRAYRATKEGKKLLKQHRPRR